MDTKTKKELKKKVRVTLDLTPQFYERLEELEDLVDAGSKANVIRQALQLYEYITKKTLAGATFKTVDKNGHEESVVFLS